MPKSMSCCISIFLKSSFYSTTTRTPKLPSSQAERTNPPQSLHPQPPSQKAPKSPSLPPHSTPFHRTKQTRQTKIQLRPRQINPQIHPAPRRKRHHELIQPLSTRKRSGLKAFESRKTLSSWCSSTAVMLTEVMGGMVQVL